MKSMNLIFLSFLILVVFQSLSFITVSASPAPPDNAEPELYYNKLNKRVEEIPPFRGSDTYYPPEYGAALVPPPPLPRKPTQGTSEKKNEEGEKKEELTWKFPSSNQPSNRGPPAAFLTVTNDAPPVLPPTTNPPPPVEENHSKNLIAEDRKDEVSSVDSKFQLPTAPEMDYSNWNPMSHEPSAPLYPQQQAPQEQQPSIEPGYLLKGEGYPEGYYDPYAGSAFPYDNTGDEFSAPLQEEPFYPPPNAFQQPPPYPPSSGYNNGNLPPPPPPSSRNEYRPQGPNPSTKTNSFSNPFSSFFNPFRSNPASRPPPPASRRNQGGRPY